VVTYIEITKHCGKKNQLQSYDCNLSEYENLSYVHQYKLIQVTKTTENVCGHKNVTLSHKN